MVNSHPLSPELWIASLTGRELVDEREGLWFGRHCDGMVLRIRRVIEEKRGVEKEEKKVTVGFIDSFPQVSCR